MLGYEPSEVDSKLEISDYTRCAHDLGLSSDEFMAEHNPMSVFAASGFCNWAATVMAPFPKITSCGCGFTRPGRVWPSWISRCSPDATSPIVPPARTHAMPVAPSTGYGPNIWPKIPVFSDVPSGS